MSFDTDFYKVYNAKNASDESAPPPPPVTNYLSNTELVEQAFAEYQEAINKRIAAQSEYDAFTGRPISVQNSAYAAANPHDCSRGDAGAVYNCLREKIEAEISRLRGILSNAKENEKIKKQAYESIAAANNVPIQTPASGIQNFAGMSTTTVVIIIAAVVIIAIFLARKQG